MAINAPVNPDQEPVTPQRPENDIPWYQKKAVKIGGAVAGVVAAVGAGVGIGHAVSSRPEAPQATYSVPANPNTSPSPIDTPTASAPETPSAMPSSTPTESMSPSAEPSESATTPEKQGNETLTNIDTLELSTELVEVYDSIADKVEAGDITYEDVQKLKPAEQALVQQSLLHRLIKNGAGNMDTSICYMNMKFIDEDPQCNANFASKDDRNEAVYGKYIGLKSAPVAYTDDGAMGLSATLEPEASRILGDMAFANPHNVTAHARFGNAYDSIQARIDAGNLVKFRSMEVDVTNPKGGAGKTSRVIEAQLSADGDTVENRAEFNLVTYKLSGSTANKILGLSKNQKVEIAQWKLILERRLS